MIQAGRHDLIAATWRQVIPVAGAALAYGIAVGLHGSGFIAAFVAGAVFRFAYRKAPARLTEFSEELGTVLNGVTFVLFGAVLLGPALTQLSWELLLYAVLSLTLVRMVSVAVAMLGSGARAPTVAFLGWFGPRGLASIVFAVIVIEESRLPERGADHARDLRHRRAVRPRPRAHGGAAGRPLRALGADHHPNRMIPDRLRGGAVHGPERHRALRALEEAEQCCLLLTTRSSTCSGR